VDPDPGSRLVCDRSASVCADTSPASVGLCAAFAGTRIAHNSIGRDQAAAPAPVTRGIELRQPSTGTLVSGAAIAYATTGISVAADVGGVSVTGNRFVQNTFQVLTGLAIDLNADWIANPNDPLIRGDRQKTLRSRPGLQR
jgi:hypothetical protein